MNDPGDGRSLGRRSAGATAHRAGAPPRAARPPVEAGRPVVAPILVLAALFAPSSPGSASLGVWFRRGPDRPPLLFFSAAAALVLAWHAFRVRRPGRLVLARVEQATGAPPSSRHRLHRPSRRRRARPHGQALWAAHRARLLASLERGARAACRRPASPAATAALRDSSAILVRRRRLRLCRAGARRAAPRGLHRRRAAGGDRRPHRCLGDPADLYRPRPDFPHEAARPEGTVYSVPAAASSRSAPAAPATST